MTNHQIDVDRMRNLSIGNTRKASTSINIAVVGGGIGGLACAYALSISGHHVHVFEKSSGLHQRSAGLRVPPNLSKILQEWGLHDLLAAQVTCRKTQFISLHTGELRGILEWQEDIIREAGGEFLLMHHDDLHYALYNLATTAGATVLFNKPVKSVHVDEDKQAPVLILEDGSEMTADLVIGADGYRSVVREVVAPEATAGTDSHRSMYTITVAASELRKDPELCKWADLSEWTLWMGDHRSVQGYPIRGGKEYNIHVFWPDEDLKYNLPAEEGWDVSVPTDMLDFSNYDPSMERLFRLKPEAIRTKFVRREIADDWMDESGRVLLIGEAAHPLLPCTIHNTSLAIEDAAVLGILMSRLHSKEQVPQLLEAFQELRHDRSIQVHSSEFRNAMVMTLPPGEQRDMRDAGMALSLQAIEDHWSESRLGEQWDEIGAVFGYSAREAAEDWWSKWGAFTNGGPAFIATQPIDFVYHQTQVREVSDPDCD